MIHLRQQFVDPISLQNNVKEIQISVENLRLRSTPSNRSFLIASCMDINKPVFLECENEITKILDIKRTFLGNNVTRLSSPYKGGNIIEVIKKNFKVKIGDPLAIMSDLEGTKLEFFQVDDVSFNKIKLLRGKFDNLCNHYSIGAFVQNLSDQWTRYPFEDETIGMAATLKRPEAIAFIAEKGLEGIDITVQIPINVGCVKFYDVYIRTSPFSRIEPHWVPDAIDVDINLENITVTSCNGGFEAGGEELSPGNKYYVSVISKDESGSLDVNESISVLQQVIF